MPDNWTEEIVTVAGAQIQMLKVGQGEPLLLLHGSGGNRVHLMYQEELGNHYQVFAPSHPGFGTSDRPEWLETVPDAACFYLWLLDEMGLESVNVVGFSLGAWIAAEMAVMNPKVFNRLILVGAAGLKPVEGEITDIFILSGPTVVEKMFYEPKSAPEYAKFFESEPTPEQREILERNREMAARMTWKPYMYDPRLAGLLPRVKAETLVLWGRQDAIVPLECGRLYETALPNAQLKVMEDCGHSPQYEKPEEFVANVLEFLKK